MKIAYWLNGLGVGGTEKTAYLFAKHLKKDITVYTYDDADLSRKTDLEQFCKVILLDRKNPNWKLMNNYDIVHSFRSGLREWPEPGVDIFPRHFVETNVFGFYDSNPRVGRSLFMSEWLMNYTSQALGRKDPRFSFINNPVESPCTNDKFPILEDWKKSGSIIVGRCGRPDNGIYNSVNVDAVRLLRLQGYDVRFAIVAPPNNMLNDLAKLEIPFFVVEPTTDPTTLSTFYNSIDILAHARPDGETFGVNIAEAMMHGKPVVTHIATPSNPNMGVFQAQCEVVTNNKTGFVVSNNPADYSEALKKLVDDPNRRQEMGEAGRQKAVREYHVDVCVAKLEAIYDSL